jgi:hypothetical protein
MMVEPDHIKFLENPQFFDPKDSTQNKVSVQFPSAAEDIAESGKCLGCGRSTACVMHLQRVMEVGLAALAKAVGVTQQNDWGKYLKEIDLARFIHEGAESGFWGDEITPNIVAAG